MMKKIIPVGIIIALIILAPTPVFAVGSGGFENASFSAKQLGTGAAVTATPDEPAAISYNPAGIADLPGVQVQGNANFISMLTYKENNVTGNSRSTGTLSLVPTGYITINPGKIFQDKLGLGFGMDSPFGLSTKYRSNDPAAQYTGYSNYLKMYALKPTIAYKFTDKISVGGGPMWYRVEDFGGVQAYPVGAYGLGPTDGQVRLNSSGNHWGWQLGTLIKLTPKHRFGYYFRSPVVVKTSGLGKVENSTAGFTANHNFETGIHTKLSLPMNMTWAYAYQPTPKTHYEADFTWSHWRTHKRLYWVVDPVANGTDNTVMNAIRNADKDWRDSFGIQVGASHKLTKKLTLRGGSWFYWTPIPYDHFSPAVPDSNHMAISLGAGYNINKYLTADLCYYNSFYFRRHISNPYVSGTYTTYSQAFTVSVTAHWDDIFPRAFGNKGVEAEAPSIDMPGVTK
ncbi:MAG: outer membrane protein transport protein [Candidatus Omnitrophota bacterium]